MPIPNWFVNGPSLVNPPGGAVLCELNPPFTQHATIEILVHCPLSGSELWQRTAGNETRARLYCANRDTVYLTVEPGDWLRLNWIAGVDANYVQGSLYVWR